MTAALQTTTTKTKTHIYIFLLMMLTGWEEELEQAFEQMSHLYLVSQ
jgi:hypothetical protein